jgi:hypothetical protein
MAQKGDLASRLEDAKKAAAILASETGLMAAKLEAVELALCALNLGVVASVEIPNLPSTIVFFGRRGEEWGLFAQGTNFGRVPLAQASREVRLAAVAALPDLVEALIRKTSETAGEVRESIARMDKLLIELNTPGIGK